MNDTNDRLDPDGAGEGSAFHSDPRPLLLHLPCLGCPAADFAVPAGRYLKGYRVAGVDLPGAVRRADADFATDLESLAVMVKAFCLFAGLDRFILVGHSLGGALGALVARELPKAVAGFVNLEGNLFPEDCFWSRRIAGAEGEALTRLLRKELPAELKQAGGAGERRYARRLMACPDPEALQAMARSLVERTDAGDLFAAYRDLACPTVYLHGAGSVAPATLLRLAGAGKRTEAMPGSGHFPFLDRPAAFFARLSELLAGFPN